VKLESFFKLEDFRIFSKFGKDSYLSLEMRKEGRQITIFPFSGISFAAFGSQDSWRVVNSWKIVFASSLLGGFDKDGPKWVSEIIESTGVDGRSFASF